MLRTGEDYEDIQ